MEKVDYSNFGKKPAKKVTFRFSPEEAERIKHFTELGMLMSLLDYMKTPPQNGRFRGRLDSIHGLAIKYFLSIPNAKEMIANDLVRKAVEQHSQHISKKTDWENKESHIVTLVAFCLEFMEKSTFPYEQKMVDALNDIDDYFERVDNMECANYEEGRIADEKWDNILSMNLKTKRE